MTYQLGARPVEALRGLDMSIAGPGFFAIMGRSGSGKSTLLHLLAGLDSPDAGEIEVAGTRVDGLGERGLIEYRRRTVGIVFQSFNLIPTMTAVENVELPGLLAGDDPAPLRERSMELMESLGVADRATHRPESMSGGEQQRVAICRALLGKPPVLLADEPTGNLDSRTSGQLWMLLGEVAREHETTVVMVTHEPEAAAHCQRVHLIHDGTQVDEFETEGMDAGGVAARAGRALG